MLGGNDDSRDLRREFDRTLVRTKLLEITIRTPDGKTFGGKSRNISLSGISILCSEPVERNSRVKLTIGSLSGTAALLIEAEVVYIDPSGGFGARFVGPSEEAHGFLTGLIKRLRDPSFGADPEHSLEELLAKYRDPSGG